MQTIGVYLVDGITGMTDVEPLFVVGRNDDGMVDGKEVGKAILEAGVIFEEGDELHFRAEGDI